MARKWCTSRRRMQIPRYVIGKKTHIITKVLTRGQWPFRSAGNNGGDEFNWQPVYFLQNAVRKEHHTSDRQVVVRNCTIPPIKQPISYHLTLDSDSEHFFPMLPSFSSFWKALYSKCCAKCHHNTSNWGAKHDPLISSRATRPLIKMLMHAKG